MCQGPLKGSIGVLGLLEKGSKGIFGDCFFFNSGLKVWCFSGLGRFWRAQRGPGGYLEAFPPIFDDIQPHGTEL